MDIWDSFLNLHTLYWIPIIFGLFFLVVLLSRCQFSRQTRPSRYLTENSGRPSKVGAYHAKESNCWCLRRLCLEIWSATVDRTSVLDFDDDSTIRHSRDCIFFLLGINAESE